MAIATGLPIHLSDVCLELYGSSRTDGKTLDTCFTDAAGTFNATYESINGYRNSLQNFRGYKHGTTFTLTVFAGNPYYGYSPPALGIDGIYPIATVEPNAVVSGLYFFDDTVDKVFLNIFNNSGINKPDNWTEIQIGVNTFTRASALDEGYSAVYDHWIWSWPSLNIFGTSNGTQITVTII